MFSSSISQVLVLLLLSTSHILASPIPDPNPDPMQLNRKVLGGGYSYTAGPLGGTTEPTDQKLKDLAKEAYESALTAAQNHKPSEQAPGAAAALWVPKVGIFIATTVKGIQPGKPCDYTEKIAVNGVNGPNGGKCAEMVAIADAVAAGHASPSLAGGRVSTYGKIVTFPPPDKSGKKQKPVITEGYKPPCTGGCDLDLAQHKIANVQ